MNKYIDKMENIIPPKSIVETHEEYMQNFVSLLVETTQQSATFEQIDIDTKRLFHKIVDGCRQPMVVAAKNKHSTAQIFVYLIAEQPSTGLKKQDQTYDLLFPSGNLKEMLDKFNIKSVYQQVVEHLAPLTIEHKIYEIYKSAAIEINNHTGEFVFDALADDAVDICEDGDDEDIEKTVGERITEYVEGVKKLDPVRRYIGVITVSWAALAAARQAANQ